MVGIVTSPISLLLLSYHLPFFSITSFTYFFTLSFTTEWRHLRGRRQQFLLRLFSRLVRRSLQHQHRRLSTTNPTIVIVVVFLRHFRFGGAENGAIFTRRRVDVLWRWYGWRRQWHGAHFRSLRQQWHVRGLRGGFHVRMSRWMERQKMRFMRDELRAPNVCQRRNMRGTNRLVRVPVCAWISR